MSKEKQIEERLELSSIIGCAVNDWSDFCEECHKDGYSPADTVEEYVAVSVITKGYRKQSEGEWIDKPTGAYGRMQSWCSACGKHSGIGGIESNRHKPYCPNCGAKMKGV